jgi:hypothetical protein
MSAPQSNLDAEREMDLARRRGRAKRTVAAVS